MKFGCIGEHLPHSFSKEIHAHLASSDYALCELTPLELDSFMKAHDFCGINVTIPYKQAVIPYLDEIDPVAKEIGAVNTIVNRGGKLYGYNTDFGGMRTMILREGIDVTNKKVLILGTGGTSKTANAVARAMGAGEILTVSRQKREGVITYEEAYAEHADAQIIINTTPCGMYPHINTVPIEIDRFPRLCGVIDAVYNPLRTELVLAALQRGIPATGGLYMLVAQAVLASVHFTGEQYADETVERIYRRIFSQKENVVLVGMPGCGKTTVGTILSKLCDRELIDTDTCIIKKSGTEISTLFAQYGEKHFRDLESDVVAEVTAMSGKIIATGGGAVLRAENIRALRKNGRLYFLDRPLEELLPTDDRPLASTKEAIQKRYEERYGTYCACADEHIKTLGDPALTAEEIKRRHEA